MSVYATELIQKQTKGFITTPDNGIDMNKLRPVDFSGKMRIAKGVFNVPESGVQVGDIIVLCQLPKGAKVMPQSYVMFSGGNATNVVINVGSSDGQTSYLRGNDGEVQEDKLIELRGCIVNDYVMKTEDQVTLFITNGTFVKRSDSKAVIAYCITYVID
jgi:hypothetical protein